MVYIALRARTYQPTDGITSTCHQKEEENNLGSLGVTCGQSMLSSPAFVSFLDQYSKVYIIYV